MIGHTISHYEILEKLGEVRLHPSDSGEQGGPTTLKKLELRRSGLAADLSAIAQAKAEAQPLLKYFYGR